MRKFCLVVCVACLVNSFDLQAKSHINSTNVNREKNSNVEPPVALPIVKNMRNRIAAIDLRDQISHFVVWFHQTKQTVKSFVHVVLAKIMSLLQSRHSISQQAQAVHDAAHLALFACS